MGGSRRLGPFDEVLAQIVGFLLGIAVVAAGVLVLLRRGKASNRLPQPSRCLGDH